MCVRHRSFDVSLVKYKDAAGSRHVPGMQRFKSSIVGIRNSIWSKELSHCRKLLNVMCSVLGFIVLPNGTHHGDVYWCVSVCVHVAQGSHCICSCVRWSRSDPARCLDALLAQKQTVSH